MVASRKGYVFKHMHVQAPDFKQGLTREASYQRGLTKAQNGYAPHMVPGNVAMVGSF